MKMVDISAKERTERVAVATARVRMKASTAQRIREGAVEKGDVLAAAKLAAVMAAKHTPLLVPLCHPISLVGLEAQISVRKTTVEIRVEVKAQDRTGVEMEALAAACAAALTVYDMCKKQDRGMCVEAVQLEQKSGGVSGPWKRTDKATAR